MICLNITAVNSKGDAGEKFDFVLLFQEVIQSCLDVLSELRVQSLEQASYLGHR